MVKHIIKVFCAAVCIATGLCGEIDVNEIKFVPFSVEIVQPEIEKHPEIQSSMAKGTEVGVKLLAPVSNEISVNLLFKPYFLSKSAHTLILKDSNGQELEIGGVHKALPVIFSSGMTKEDHFKRESHYKFASVKYPSPGAEWLHLQGSCPAQIVCKKPLTKSVALKLEGGEEAEVENFKMKVLSVESWQESEGRKQKKREKQDGKIQPITLQHKIGKGLVNMNGFDRYFYIKVESDLGHGQIIDLILTDSNGGKLKHATCIESEKNGDVHKCGVMGFPSEIKISIECREIREINIPVDLKFNLTGKND